MTNLSLEKQLRFRKNLKFGALLGGVNFSPWQRSPTAADDTTKGFQVNDLWYAKGKVYQASSVTASAAVWNNITQAALPLDVGSTTGTFLAGAYGLSKLSSNSNIVNCLQLIRSTDLATQIIGFKANGDVDDVSADAFSASAWASNGSVEVITLYDQSFATPGGPLNTNHATMLPFYNALSATIATAGSGMTPGTFNFTVVGANNVAAVFSGTVNASGNLAGALTPVGTGGNSNLSGSYVAALTNPVSVTSSAGGTQPTLNITWTQSAPVWSTNKVNGKRVLAFAKDYGAGNPNNYTNARQGMALPAGFSVNTRFATVVAAISVNAVFDSSISNVFSFDNAASGNAFQINQSASVPGVGMFSTIASNTSLLTSPTLLTVQAGAAATTFGDNNESGSVTVAQSNTAKTTGFIGGGNQNRSSGFDFHHMIFLTSSTGVAVAAADLLKIKVASIILSQTTTQTRRNLVVGVGDSNLAGFKSIAGNNWLKFLSTLDLIPRDTAVKNLSYSGGQFVGGSYDFTANDAADWAAIYSASIPRIIAIINLGVNDMVNGATPATTFARNQAYCSFLLGLGSNVRIIQTTLQERSGLAQATINAYNALVQANWNVPIGSGGLGSHGLIDIANSFPWNTGSFANYLNSGDGAHMLDTGYTLTAQTAAPVVKSLLLH